MNGENDVDKFKIPKPVWTVLCAVLFFIISESSIFILQTVCRPYFIENKYECNGTRYETVTVINPGPWETRDPIVELASTNDGVQIIYASIGVRTMEDETLNKQFARYGDGSPNDGLPPGAIYLVTFTRGTNEEHDASVYCDGKLCKDSPTFDIGTTILMLIILGAFFTLIPLVVCCVVILLYLNAIKALAQWKKIENLITKGESQKDISESEQSVVLTLEKIKKGELSIFSRSVNSGNDREKVFEYRSNTAKDVFLAGDFTQWETNAIPFKKESSGLWRVKVNLPPGKHRYRFIVDKVWVNDPNCSTTEKNFMGADDMILHIT